MAESSKSKAGTGREVAIELHGRPATAWVPAPSPPVISRSGTRRGRRRRWWIANDLDALVRSWSG